MNRTLHKKLTEKQSFTYNQPPAAGDDGSMFTTLRFEKRILDTLSKEIMQPRPEAIANILKLAKDL